MARFEAFAQTISLSINLLFSEECRRLFSPKNTGGYFVLQGSLRKRAKWLGLKLKLKFHILDNRIFESPRLTSIVVLGRLVYYSCVEIERYAWISIRTSSFVNGPMLGVSWVVVHISISNLYSDELQTFCRNIYGKISCSCMY